MPRAQDAILVAGRLKGHLIARRILRRLMEQPRSLFWHSVFAVFLLAYAVILFQQLDHGLASLDAHAIVKVTRELVDNHHIEVSRPPGHPTTEFYLLGAIAWVLRHAFDLEFTDKFYLALQALGGIAALCLFYELLWRLETPLWKAFTASVCLALSAQYFSNTVDGEEFVFAVLFLVLSIRLLIVKEPSASVRLRLFLSISSFGLATGCRPEAVFAGFLFPVYCLLRPNLGWRYALISILLQAVMIAVVWLPVVIIGLHPPYTAGMNARESILGGCYRLVFQCFTVPVFLIFCWIVFQSIREWPHRVKNPFPQNFIFIISCMASVIFCLALFLHASKPAHVIFVVPFVLLLATQLSSGLIVSLALLTILGCFVSVDIFKERQLLPPFPVAGTYFQATRQKPYYRLPYLRQVLQQNNGAQAIIIADAWRWDFEYHIKHGTLALREETVDDLEGNLLPIFLPPDDVSIVLPRDGALHDRLLENWQTRGYPMKMDSTLYRTLFARYDVTAPRVNRAQVGNISFELFSTNRNSN
jgi:hypothetical protein